MDTLVEGIMKLLVALMTGMAIVVLAGTILMFYSMHPYIGGLVTIFFGIPCVYLIYGMLSAMPKGD